MPVLFDVVALVTLCVELFDNGSDITEDFLKTQS